VLEAIGEVPELKGHKRRRLPWGDAETDYAD
jgi:hypothetical protein